MARRQARNRRSLRPDRLHRHEEWATLTGITLLAGVLAGVIILGPQDATTPADVCGSRDAEVAPEATPAPVPSEAPRRADVSPTGERRDRSDPPAPTARPSEPVPEGGDSSPAGNRRPGPRRSGDSGRPVAPNPDEPEGPDGPDEPGGGECWTTDPTERSGVLVGGADGDDSELDVNHDDELDRAAVSYAVDYGVSWVEARQRLDQQQALAELATAIEDLAGTCFAGAWSSSVRSRPWSSA